VTTAGISRAAFLRGAAGALIAASLPLRAESQGVPAMLTRPIPSTGEAMPVIGVGTWQTFDVGWEPAARAPLRQVLELLVAGGGKMIDTSPMYGRAEAVTGDLLAEMGARPKAFLATKVWTTGRERGIEQMRRSAELLKSDVIDLMQIHNLVDWETYLATLRRMKEEGRIRYIGITHYTTGALPELARIVEREKVDFVQLGYSIETREPERRLLPLCAERGVAVIANQPFEEGALFRKARGKALPPWAAELGCASWAQFFLKFLVGHPAVTCVIPGTAKPEHMRDNLGGGAGPLPDESQRRRMAEFWASL
jgi:diketogulonate reductase-like aldo/keto reductase